MNQRHDLILGVVLSLMAAILACNLPGNNAEAEISIAATQTVLARAVQDLQDQQQQNEQAQTEGAQTEGAQADQGQAASPAETATATETPQPQPSETPTPTPEPAIEHLTQPGEPERIRTWISDISSKPYAPEKRTIGDSLNVNLLERPFTAGEMNYQPYLDITRVEIGPGDEWIYVVLILEGEPPQVIEESVPSYAIEIDIDRDGRGDWLISALLPPGNQWTTEGVRVWQDTNENVGGQLPMSAEAPLGGLDGYDQLIFDQGRGDDADIAWVRRGPNSALQVHLAFKHTLIDSSSTFLWGGWTDEGLREPGQFDYNDQYTLALAGSPLINNANYPLKDLFSMDNTCRWTYGFEPTTAYPGLCPLPTPTATFTRTPKPTLCPPPPGGCPTFTFGSIQVQYIWDTNRCQCVEP
jgi:hypothetical protein